MMTKKWIALLAALTLLLGLACAGAEGSGGSLLDFFGSKETEAPAETEAAEQASPAAPRWPEGFSYDFSDRAYLLPINAESGVKASASGYTSATHYKDSTIEVTITTGSKYSCEYWVADIIVQDPSQLRTMAAGAARNFAYNSEEDALSLAKKSNGIVAINGDFHTDNSRGGLGFVIRQGTLYLNNLDTPGRWNSRMADVLLIDEDGDFHVLHQPGSNEVPQLIGGKRILNAFTFGPILVENGELVRNYDGSESWMDMAEGILRQRICICQAGPLHYKVICCSGPSYGQPGMTLRDFAKVAAGENVQIAYNLDGGDSTMLYFHGDKINGNTGRNTLRKLHDIIYFASAEGKK